MATVPVKFFKSTMQGAPQLSAAWGAMTALLDAVLVNGFNLKSVTTLTSSAGVATVTIAGGHGYWVDQVIAVAGADQAAYNGEFRVLSITTTTLTYAVEGTGGCRVAAARGDRYPTAQAAQAAKCGPGSRALPLGGGSDLRLQLDARLVEMDFGCWEGFRWDAIPKAEIDAWTAQFWHGRFGGRDSVEALMTRVDAAWTQAQGVTEPVVWVTHAGVIRAAMLLAEGVRSVRRADQWPTSAPGFGQLLCL